MQSPREPDTHPFISQPHRTLFGLTLPVLLSLVAEPLTGIVDTAFVARLGAAELAALGAATTLLSSIFWIFNFLGIGTQTEVARGAGGDAAAAGREAATLALILAVAIGVVMALLAWPLLPAAGRLMSPERSVQEAMRAYLGIRLLAAPAVLLSLAAFGALRGLQEMRATFWIAATANVANALLDPILIFGWGPLPALGIAGAAWASTIGQWLAALWAVVSVRKRFGLGPHIPWHRTPQLLTVGRDLFLRTGLLTLFLLLATRAATRLGADAGAAHQVVRQVWLLAAFLLDAYAATAQSLVAYFLGARRRELARRVAGVSCAWGLATGIALMTLMLAGEGGVARLLVPGAARQPFSEAWLVLALAMPLNAISFVTDGIHWGTGDYRYLRNAMFVATGCGVLLLAVVPRHGPDALALVWDVTAVWITLRAVFGALRVWPGFGAAPLTSDPPASRQRSRPASRS